VEELKGKLILFIPFRKFIAERGLLNSIGIISVTARYWGVIKNKIPKYDTINVTDGIISIVLKLFAIKLMAVASVNGLLLTMFFGFL
jgi:hypothetical protein